MTRIELVTSSLPRKRSTPELQRQNTKRARDGAQTRDPQLGRLMLYQLSYSRIISPHAYRYIYIAVKFCGKSRIRTYEDISQRSYSPPQLATLVSSQHYKINRADERIRTADPLITNQLLWPTELHRHSSYFQQFK